MSDPVQNDSAIRTSRCEWLDQARGTIILFLLVTMAASALTGGGNSRLRPILAPTFLTHGHQYANVEPRMITIVDHGAQLFLFYLGFSGWQAFTRRRRISKRAAWLYVARRAGSLLIISFVLVALREWRGDDPYNWHEALYEGTFGKLAIAAVACGLLITVAPSPWVRLTIGSFLLLLHMILWDQIELTVEVRDSWLGQMKLPWGALNSVAVAVIGTAFGQWVFEDPTKTDRAFRTKIFDGLIWFFIAFYLTSWLQHSRSFELTTSHALGGIFFSLFFLMLMYSLEQLGMKFPGLTALGRNLFLLFLVAGIGTEIYSKLVLSFFDRETLAAWPSVCLLLFGIVPYIVTFRLAGYLDRKQIYVKI